MSESGACEGPAIQGRIVGHTGEQTAGRIPESCNEQNESCHRTDDDGHDERTGHGDKRLFNRMVGLGIPRNEGCRSESGFIGENPFGEPAPHGLCDYDSTKSSCSCNRVECIFKDQGEGGDDHIVIDEDDQKGSSYIKERHDRDEEGCNGRDPLYAPEDDECCQYSQGDPCNPWINREACCHDIGNRIRLDAVADSECCKCAE